MRTETVLALVCLGLAAGCDEESTRSRELDPVEVGGDAGEEAPPEDAQATDEGDAQSERDASEEAVDAAASERDASDPALIERGRYLTSHVVPCGSCHTSRSEPGKVFGGVDCWTDSLPTDPTMGCLSSKNLTPHETGLKNASLAEIEDMILKGLRPDGKYLHPHMPYSLMGNMRESDAFAIAAFLKTLAPVDHMVAPNQAPFNVQPSAPAPRWPEAEIPAPRADYADQAAALRGRYLAGSTGACMDCHTPRNSDNTPALNKAFQGGRRFTFPGIPDPFFSPNLTPHATGIAEYTLDDVVRAIKRGEDKNQGYSKLCPPMPAGPMGGYGGLTDEDARDIAHYLLSLPPAENMIAGDCQLPPPDAGVPDASVDAGDAATR